MFTGRCLDPASIGLEEHAGVWGTPEGNANRQRLSAGMASCRAAQARALAQTADQDHPGGKDMGQLFTPLDFAPLVAPMPSIGS